MLVYQRVPDLIPPGRLKCRLRLMGQSIDLFDFNWGSTDVKLWRAVLADFWSLFFFGGGSNLLIIWQKSTGGHVQQSLVPISMRQSSKQGTFWLQKSRPLLVFARFVLAYGLTNPRESHRPI